MTANTAWLQQRPVQAWLLAGLAAADFVVRLSLIGIELTPALVLSAANGAAMPLLLAATVVYLAPARRLIVAGALLLAVAGLLDTAQRLVAVPDVARLVLALVIAGATVVGIVMLGRSLIRGYPAWGLALLALAALFTAVRIVALADSYVAAGLFEPDSGLPLARAHLLVGAIAQLKVLGWAYLLVAAIGRRYWLIALGAALPIAATLMLAAFDLLPHPTGVTYPIIGLLWTLLEVGGFAALIGGVVRELRPARIASAG